MRKDTYQEVTNIIIEALETGVKPWVRPWEESNIEPLRHNGEAYKGINTVTLWAVAMKKGYQSQFWMTFKQAKELGAQVKKGEKSAPVFYANKLVVEDEESQNEELRTIHYMKSYSVFNAEQIEGLPQDFYFTPKKSKVLDNSKRIKLVDDFIANTGAEIINGSNAGYSPFYDHIALPKFEQFNSANGYYATALHELSHWTGAKHRLNRIVTTEMAEKEYAKEELVAELAATFLGASLGLSLDITGNHASYINGWLKVLKEDKRAIFRASSQAQKAADFLHNLQLQQAKAA